MLSHAIRLLVAFLTFAIGVAASTLFSSGSSPKRAPACDKTRISAFVSAPVVVELPQTPKHACNTRLFASVLNGKAISKPAPVYPADAKAAGIEGTVTVQITVDESGRVISAEALSGPLLLRDAATDAARVARFSPTLLSGQPVKVSGTVSYNFLLD
jgi:TonB family protein